MKLSQSLIVALVAITAVCATACNSGNGRDAGDELANVESGTTAEALREHIEYLSSDELTGRAPGSKGEELTLSYLAEQYAELGLRPGNPQDGTYVQRVPLISATVTNSPGLRLKTPIGRETLDYMRDFMGWTLRQEPLSVVNDAELVFVGYGIVAPEYGWDDYKDTDVTGKIIVMLVGDPPLADDTMFGGRAMTYYGRWTYKFEIAAEKGAAGAIVIHSTASAGYPWAVVSNSWSGEQFDIVRDDGGETRCPMESWITEPAAERVFKAAGLELPDMYRRALSPNFRPMRLGVTGSCRIETDFRRTRSYNAVAILPGSDPVLRDEYIVYTAHWDHLGIGHPVEGDSIYNGALDNASGVAATLEIARALARERQRLKRSVVFINTTAEESGLLGAKQYVASPLYPLEHTIALINIDGLNVWGRTRDVVVVGYGYSDLDDYLERAIASHKRHLKPDTEPEKGYYYRSDHFPFAQKGVPALYADSGIEYLARPEHWGRDVKSEYTNVRYHKPQDEWDPEWNLDGAIEDIDAYFRVGMMLAGTGARPQWSDRSEFRRVRDESLGASR